ncbi:type II secretion system F family protein [Brevibacillus composti]|uniref:Type II secretion system F family protein n=1 Tax=Brevibacillus composti TaxID=2796470 RepID=A0A7T5ELE1_9BACL|nr:type II secretion system F family protein [Brevibacillus composti]QQE74756.1 type II secretion system F family protein [Brevibacillus composti]QUO41841.1 type II secretion system F family protein [Brevibacillus composti]
MLMTYIAVMLSLYVLLRSFIELLYVLIYGEFPQKKGLIRQIERLNHVEASAKKRSGVLSRWLQLGSSSDSKTLDYLLITVSGVLLYLFGLLLFQNQFFAILSGLMGIFVPRTLKKNRQEKLRQIMILQFREAILSIASSLKAGASLQVALLRCQQDLAKQLGHKKERPMLDELEKLNRDIQFGVSLEEALQKFRDAINQEDVTQFVDAALITKSRGGNLAEVIQNTTMMITDKITVQQEIMVATAQKRMEAKMLTFMPLGIVLVIMVLNPGYMEPMYDSWVGSSLMFLAALMLIANYFLGRAITKINI